MRTHSPSARSSTENNINILHIKCIYIARLFHILINKTCQGWFLGHELEILNLLFIFLDSKFCTNKEFVLTTTNKDKQLNNSNTDNFEDNSNNNTKETNIYSSWDFDLEDNDTDNSQSHNNNNNNNNDNK